MYAGKDMLVDAVDDVVAVKMQPLRERFLPFRRLPGTAFPAPLVPRDVIIPVPHQLAEQLVLVVEGGEPAARKHYDAAGVVPDRVLVPHLLRLLAPESGSAGGADGCAAGVVLLHYAAREGEGILSDVREHVHIAPSGEPPQQRGGERHAAVYLIVDSGGDDAERDKPRVKRRAVIHRRQHAGFFLDVIGVETFKGEYADGLIDRMDEPARAVLSVFGRSASTRRERDDDADARAYDKGEQHAQNFGQPSPMGLAAFQEKVTRHRDKVAERDDGDPGETRRGNIRRTHIPSLLGAFKFLRIRF